MLLPLFTAAALCVGFFTIVSAELRPLLETVAVSKSTNLITSLIGTAVDECLSDEEICYESFVAIDTDDQGNVLSLSARPVESSRFKRQVVESIVDKLGSISSEELDIPIGNLTGSILLSGFGPSVRVRLYTIGGVTAAYANSFTAAGVNQTHHSIYLDISTVVHLLIPGRIIPVEVRDRICVAETIIIGRVPDTYVSLDKGSE